MEGKSAPYRASRKKHWGSLPIGREMLSFRETLFDKVLDSEAVRGLPDFIPSDCITVEEQLVWVLVFRALNGDLRAMDTIFSIAFD